MLARGRDEWPGYHFRAAEPRYPVLYISPRMKSDERVLGLNLAIAEPRRLAIERARDEGEMTLISQFDFPLDAPGTAVLHPVYEGTPTTLEERRAQFRGVVIVAVPTDALLTSAFEASLATFHVETSDFAASGTG